MTHAVCISYYDGITYIRQWNTWYSLHCTTLQSKCFKVRLLGRLFVVGFSKERCNSGLLGKGHHWSHYANIQSCNSKFLAISVLKKKKKKKSVGLDHVVQRPKMLYMSIFMDLSLSSQMSRCAMLWFSRFFHHLSLSSAALTASCSVIPAELLMSLSHGFICPGNCVAK